MKHLRKFNEEISPFHMDEDEKEAYESGKNSENKYKYFWLKSDSGLTIGEYNPNPKHEDGSDNEYPWNLIGSDEIYKEEDIRNMYDVLDEILPPQ